MKKYLRVERNADALVVHFLEKRIDADVVIGGLGEELYAVADQPDCLKLVLSFLGVEFFSTTMLGKLLIVKKKMAEKNGGLRLCEMCPNIRLIFTVTFLDQILHIRETEAEAIGQ